MTVQAVSAESFQTFGDLLKYLRRRRRMTQVELSIQVGYSDAQISRLEQNQRLPVVSAIKALFVPALQLEYEPEFVERLLALAQSARLEDAPEAGAPPYKGLVYFDQGDGELFFGRETITGRLVRRVNQLAAGDRRRFLAIVGASGSGKSSLARAGLARSLGLAGWGIHIFTPTAAPMKMLESQIRQDHAEDNQNQLVLVDQFEEVFTLCRDENERLNFIERLLATAEGRSARATVVITLRADFYSHCAQYPRLREAAAAEQEYIGQMTIAELRCAIDEPAKRGGWEFEPGLVDTFIQDISVDRTGQLEPGALPLLSHALLATWERRRGRTLTHEGYRASGGVRGAIAETAESVFIDQLNQAQQDLARSIFLRLTELGEGTEDTRRRAGLNELLRPAEEANQARGVLNRLAAARLVTLNQDSAEVAHEALIREWQRLREWLDADRENLLLHRHLTEAALDWNARGRDGGDLYRGARLAQALEWAEQPGRGSSLSSLEQEFLAASRADADRQAQEMEAQRRRELATAQRLAETEQRRAAEQAAAARRLRRRAYYLVGLALLLVLLAGLALNAAASANKNAQMAAARELISSARAGLPVDSGKSIELALQSIQAEPQLQGYSVLHQALLASHLRGSVQALPGDASYIAINQAGDRLATSGGTPGTVKVWELHGAIINPKPLLTITDVVADGGCKDYTATKLAFSPDGGRLAVVDCSTEISLIDTRSGAVIRKITPAWEEVYGLGFSPDGRWLAAFNSYGIFTVWDARDGQVLLNFQGHDHMGFPDSMTDFAFRPDGKVLATGGMDGEIKFWRLEIENGALQEKLVGRVNQQNEDFIRALRFSPDGQKLADATLEAVHILDVSPLDSNQPTAELYRIPFDKENIQVNSVDFTPAGDRLVVAQLGSVTGNMLLKSSGNRIQMVDVATGHILSSLTPREQLMAGVLSPDGRVYFSTHAGGLLHSWDVSYPGSPEGVAIPLGGKSSSFYSAPDGKQFMTVTPVNLEGGAYRFERWKIAGNQLQKDTQFTVNLGQRQEQVQVSPDLNRIIIIDSGKLIHIFNAENGAELKTMQLGSTGSFLTSLLLNTDASRLMMKSDTSNKDSIMEVWDLNAERRLSRLTINDAGYSLAFDRDGKGIISYSSNNHPRLIRWLDPETGRETRALDAQNGVLFGVIFSPDQKYLLSWGDDQTVKIREAASGRLVCTLTPPAQITAVMVSPDQKKIAVSLSTAETVLYDFDRGTELDRLPGSGAAFLMDGKIIFERMPDDPTVYGLLLDHNDLTQLACARLNQLSPGSSGGAANPLKICHGDAGNP